MQRLRLTSGPRHFYLFINIFKHPQVDIRIGDLTDVKISPNFAGQETRTQGATSRFVSSSKS
jgi:hypothetical protein